MTFLHSGWHVLGFLEVIRVAISVYPYLAGVLMNLIREK